VTTVNSVPANRRDNYYIAGARLTTIVLKRLTLAALYQRSQDVSNQGGFGFASNQAGVEMSYRY